MVAQSVGQALALGLGGGAESAMILAAYGLGAQYGVLLPYGRTQESEADHIGLLLMAQAGYDPHTAVEFWRRMEQSGGSGTPEFLSTHPSHGTRVKQLREWMPAATRLYDGTPHAPNARLTLASASTH